MNLLKNTISYLLILVIISSGIPIYLVEDATHDGVIDLEDAILQVQDFTESAESTISFSLHLEKMVSTLSSIAGLKTLINPNKEDKSSQKSASIVVPLDTISNSFTIHFPHDLTGTKKYPKHLIIYESKSFAPTTPPPRIS